MQLRHFDQVHSILNWEQKCLVSVIYLVMKGKGGGGNVISKTILLGVETYLFVKQKTKAPLQRFH